MSINCSFVSEGTCWWKQTNMLGALTTQLWAAQDWGCEIRAYIGINLEMAYNVRFNM